MNKFVQVFEKNSTSFLLYIRRLQTKRIEFSGEKFKIWRGLYYCGLEYKFCFGLQSLETKELEINRFLLLLFVAFSYSYTLSFTFW